MRRWLLGLLMMALALACTPGPTTTTTLPAAAITTPDAAYLVPDDRQLTGVRLALPLPDCGRRPSDCNELRLLNTLDGFDLDPRVTLAFREPLAFAPPQLAAELDGDVLWVGREGTPERISFNRFVYDPATRVLAAHPREPLREGTRYRVVYQPQGRAPVAMSFVTHSATAGLTKLREQLDDGSAYTAAGIAPGERGLRVRARVDAAALRGIVRYDDTGAGALRPAPVLNTVGQAAGRYAVGSVSAPSWLGADRTMATGPTGSGRPAVTGRAELGVLVVVPPGRPPPQGWPVAIYGTGLGGSKLDVLAAAERNAARRIATVATDPVGHGGGPRSQVGLITARGEVRVPALGRGDDTDGDGRITAFEGVSAPVQPHPRAAVGLRDGLRQSAADQMVLARALRAGVDTDGDGVPDLRRDRVGYFGVSLGSIYGAMAVAVDPLLSPAVLNVGGGPLTLIGRLSPAFRPQTADALARRLPPLRNGGVAGFTESLPLFDEAPVTEPAPGAMAIQETLARQAWLGRSGSPETFAPGLARQRVLLQVAWGDRTLPNPASATVIRAGGLAAMTALYRNDRTASAAVDPHGLLLNPLVYGRLQAQEQLAVFLASDGRTIVDPDGDGSVWEMPLTDLRALARLNFEVP